MNGGSGEFSNLSKVVAESGSKQIPSLPSLVPPSLLSHMSTLFSFLLCFGLFIRNSQERAGISSSLCLQQTPYLHMCANSHLPPGLSLDLQNSRSCRWQWRSLEVPRHLCGCNWLAHTRLLPYQHVCVLREKNMPRTCLLPGRASGPTLGSCDWTPDLGRVSNIPGRNWSAFRRRMRPKSSFSIRPVDEWVLKRENYAWGPRLAY